MAGDFQKKITLVADLSSLQQDMQRVSETLKTLSNEVINVQMQINGRNANDVINDLRVATGTTAGAGHLYDAQGRPISSPQQQMRLPTATTERMTKAAEKFSKELDSIRQKQVQIVTAMADASDKQKEIMRRELHRLQEEERSVRSMQSVIGGAGAGGGGTTGGGMMGLIGNLMRAVGIGTAVQAVSTGIGIPLQLEETRAARAGIATRDIQAMQRLDFDDIMRLSPGMRERAQTGRRIRQGQNLLGGLGWGAGIGAGIGSFIPGIGTALGAGIGGAGGLLYRLLTGQTERAGIAGFEEHLGMLTEQLGPRRELFNVARQRSMGRLPGQLSMGMGDEAFRNFVFSNQGIMGNINRLGFMEPELLQGLGGLRGMGGNQFAMQNLSRFSFLGRGAGIGLNQLGGMLGMAGGAGGGGIDQLAQALAIAVKEGFDNSEQFRKYLDATLSLAQTAGGGFGGAFSRNIMDAIGAARDTLPDEARGMAPGIGTNFLQTFNQLQTRRQGFGGVANFVGAQRALNRNRGFQNLASNNPRLAQQLMIQVAMMNPDMLRNTEVQGMLRNAGVTDPETLAQDVIRSRAAQMARFFPFGGQNLANAIEGGDELTSEQQLQMQLMFQLTTGNQGMMGFQFGKMQQGFLGRMNRPTGEAEGRAVFGGRVERQMGTTALRFQQLQEEMQMSLDPAAFPQFADLTGMLEERGGGKQMAANVLENINEVTRSAGQNIKAMSDNTAVYNEALKRAIDNLEMFNKRLRGDETNDKDIAEDASAISFGPSGPGISNRMF